jgi:hypothetical protein
MRRGLGALLVVMTVASGTAAAQPSAVELPPAPSQPPNVGFGARLGGGVAYANGVSDAWHARLDNETFLFITPRGTVGGLFGFLTGFDFWRGEPNNWGFGLPTAFVVGMRAVVLRGTIGVGFNGLIVDQVDDDTGVGFAAPLALANLGFDIHGVSVLADARVTRRWLIGADDHTQWTFGVTIGATLESRHNRAAFDGRPAQRRRQSAAR